MRKLSITMLAVVMIMGLAGLSSAADVKISGKVDVRQNLGGLSVTETGYNLKAFDLREARLIAKATITDKISAQISNNFDGAGVATLETNNPGLGDTYINIALGGGNLLIGQTNVPGYAIRETFINKEIFVGRLTGNAMNQIRYSGKADVVSYAIAVVDGTLNTKGATTKDVVVNVGADVSGVNLGATYNFDSNDDVGGKNSFFAANVGYALNPVDLTVQFIGGLDDTIAGATDISDAAKSAPKSEIVLDVGYKINEKHSLNVGYDMFGKTNAVIVKGNCKIADGVTGILRADIVSKKYLESAAARAAANNISLGVAAEF
ncbi:MAG: hypothetical protein AB1498_08640 [bacterium]